MSIQTLEKPRTRGPSLLQDRKKAHDIEIGKRLRVLRLSNEMSQEALAVAMDITFQQVQKYESGSNHLNIVRMKQACDILEVNLSYFIDEKLSSSDSHLLGRSVNRYDIRMRDAFSRITDPGNRRLVISMVEALADKS